MGASLLLSAAPVALAAEYTKDNPLKVALVIHGTLGDKSFFDSAAKGMKRAESQLPVSVKVIEASYDRSRWQPALEDATDGDCDVIIAGTFDMTGFVAALAPQHPAKKFIVFDDAPDFSTGCCANVLGIQYQTSSAGYLAGYAAEISRTGTLGTIIGMTKSSFGGPSKSPFHDSAGSVPARGFRPRLLRFGARHASRPFCGPSPMLDLASAASGSSLGHENPSPALSRRITKRALSVPQVQVP